MQINKLVDWFGVRSSEDVQQIQTLEHELEGQMNALHNAAIVSETDVKGNITFVNDKFCEISGYRRDELLGQNHRIIKSDEHPPEVFQDLWRTIANGHVWRGEIKNRTKEGGYYWVIATITPILNPDTGKPERYVSVRFDITQQKDTEAELQQTLEEVNAQDEELRQTAEQLNETNEQLVKTQRELQAQVMALNNAAIVSETDVKGNITYANDMFCRISQYSREELIGQNHRLLKSDYHSDEFWRTFWRTIARGDVWQGIVKNKAKDGSHYWVHTTVTPVLNQDGKPQRYIAVRVDITSEIEKEQQLQDSSQSIQELNQSLSLAKDQLEKQLHAKSSELEESVTYAQRLQRTILPKHSEMQANTPEGFDIEVFYQPRGAVGGDFYWTGAWRNKRIFMIGDGTGHGVPGAFLTIMGITGLNSLVEERGVTDPSALLDELNLEFRKLLHQEEANGEEHPIDDSLEGSVVSFVEGNPQLQVASAMRPMIVVRNDASLESLTPDKKSIGGRLMHRDEYYSSQNVNLEPGETLYLFSDGYQDQLGGPAGTSKRMGRSQFQALLQELNGFASLADRAQLLQQRFQDWKGFFREQNDDIVIMMIRRKEG